MNAGPFSPAARVRVHRYDPIGHTRTPRYVRGKPGTVVARTGPFPNPEELTYARPGLPGIYLYRVSFRQADLWPDYRGTAFDNVVVDIFEHWLEAGEE